MFHAVTSQVIDLEKIEDCLIIVYTVWTQRQQGFSGVENLIAFWTLQIITCSDDDLLFVCLSL